MIPRLASSAALPATGAVAVARGTRAGRTAAVLDTLAAAGVRRPEVTLNTPGTLEEPRGARRRPPAEIELGAGGGPIGVALGGGSLDAPAERVRNPLTAVAEARSAQ